MHDLKHFSRSHCTIITLMHLNVGSSYAGGQWAAGDEPLYYIVSPKDVVIAKPRSVLILLLTNVIFVQS